MTAKVPGRLWAIDAPHFCAALVVLRGRVVDAAPILRWALGKPWSEARAYMKRKGWTGAPLKMTSKLYEVTP